MSFSCNAEVSPNAKSAAGEAGRGAPLAASAARDDKSKLARITSRDAAGRPRMLVGQPAPLVTPPSAVSAEQVARLELKRHAHVLGLGADVMAATRLQAKHNLATGASVWQFGQYQQDVEVFGARASVLLDRDKHLVALANHLTPATHEGAKQSRLSWQAPEQTVAWAYTQLTGDALSASAVHTLGKRGDWQDFDVSAPSGQAQVRQVAAKQVVFPDGDKLVPAYHVELLLRPTQREQHDHAYGYVLGADGRVLYAADLTAFDAFNYRVWVDDNGVPTDGPMLDITPYPSAVPDKQQLTAAPQVLMAVEGFNHNPDGLPDPWLAPAASVSFGNNVQAYSDRNQYTDLIGFTQHDGFDEGQDIRADVTAPGVFDRSYDVSLEPNASTDQVKAAVTQIFYVTNWLHDYWYDSGFDEQSKNAQLENFGRGGVDNDPLLAEAQDSADDGASNNANMSTFSDGRSPRMQMYVWSGAANRTLVTEPPTTFDDGIGAASFGPQTFDLSANKLTLVLADDGSTALPLGANPTGGTTSDACQVPSNVQGKVAVIERGSCTFDLKLQNAQTAGAAAVVLLDNAVGHTPPNPAPGEHEVTLPVLTLSYEDGSKLTTLLTGTGPAVSAATPTAVIATSFVRRPEPERDGTIDNTIVAHEWGHYLHHRLVLCSSATCNGMSEGWADFIALMMVIREGDTFPGKVYPMAQYAAGGLNLDAGYFGIRRAPYSVELDKNPFTFQHVRRGSMLPSGMPLAAAASDMSEVHNVGEIWAETLFEAYANLIEAGKARGVAFADIKRHMADYVVTGMKAAPVDPSFVEQRDAILLAAHTLSKDEPARSDDFAALARGFAKRGMGIGAVAPPISSKSLNETVESFVFKGEVAVKDVTLDDSLVSCDQDGILDASEAGLLTFTLANTGWMPLTQGNVKVISQDDAVKITPTPALPLATLQPYDETTLRFGVVVDPSKQGIGKLRVVVSSGDPDAANVNVEYPFDLRYNVDDVLASSTSDDAESDQPAWVVSSDSDPTVTASTWQRDGDGTNHFWHGDDLGTVTDQSLVSPELMVSEDQPLLISFQQRYSFEFGPALPAGPSVGFDGGVIEISRDDGESWQDISKYANPDYPGKIFKLASTKDRSLTDTNVLAGRDAFIGASPGYPEYRQVTLNLGKELAGKKIKLRFRIATDEGTSAAGWDIDDIAFGSATVASLSNTPFPSLREDTSSCVPNPVP